MAVINNLKSGGTKLPESVFYGFWIAEVSINNAAMGYNIYKIYDNGTMDVLEVTVDGTIQNDVKGITYTVSGKVLTPNASAGTLTYQEDGTLYQLYNGQLPLTFTKKLFSDGALSVTENGTYQALGNNGYSTVEVNVQGGDYDIEVTENDDGTQSLYITDSDSSIDRNAIIKGLVQRDITTFEIPDGTTKIGDGAFSRFSGLTSINIPSGVTSIGYSAFSYCTGLTSITIPDSVTSIGNNAFSYCSGLTNVKLPNTLKTLKDYAFYYCKNLHRVEYLGTIENWLDINISANASSPLQYSADLYINNILLTDVEIPSTITTIKYGVFRCCTSLTNVTIHENITTIPNATFYGCTSLTEMTILATTPPTLQSTNAISTATTTIYIPNGTLEAYRTATNWSSFASKFVELEV